jgi:predicted CoA-binding protein
VKRAQDEFLTESKHIAVYGLKRSGKGFACDVARELKRGIPAKLYAVHPQPAELSGWAAVTSAGQLQQPLDSALIMLKVPQARLAIDDAAAVGITRVWLPFDSAKGGNVEYARSRGLTAIEGCPLLHLESAGSFHRFHRFLARLFGRI